MAHLSQCSHLDQSTLPQYAHAITEGFHLAHDVGGQQYGLVSLLGFVNADAEGLLHQRVEAARRFVEDQEVGTTRQRRDEHQLLPISLGIGSDLLGRVEVESLDQLVAVRRICLALYLTKEMKCLGPGERGPEVHLPRHIGKAPVRLNRPGLAVESEDLSSSGSGTGQPQQQADGRRLARAVWAEVAEYLPWSDLEVESLERGGGSVPLGQSNRPDGRYLHAGRQLRLVSHISSSITGWSDAKQGQRSWLGERPAPVSPKAIGDASSRPRLVTA